ncbi:MAG: hypothetical protein RL090_1855 [Bacteroidota bacterium]
MENHSGTGKKTAAITIALILAIGFVDLCFQNEVVWSMLFIAPVTFSFFHPNARFTTLTSVFCSAFTIGLGVVEGVKPFILMNQLITLAGIWSAWFAIIIYRRSVERLHKERERLKALFDYSTEGIVIADKSGAIVMINPTAEKKFGYQKGELIGQKIELLIPDRFGNMHVRHREHFVKNPHSRPMGQGMQLFAKRKDGGEFPVEISLSTFNIDKNSFVIAFIIDVSERAAFLDQIRKEKDLAQMYLEIAPVMFATISMDQRVTLINQQGCKILGLPESTIIGKNWFDIFKPDETREEDRATFIRIKESPPDQDYSTYQESQIVTATGERKLIAGSFVIIRDSDGKPHTLLFSGEDVTEKRQQERLIEKANLELKANSEEILKLNSELEARVEKRTRELADLLSKMELTNVELATEVRERRQAEELLQKNREELRASLAKEKELGELKSRFVTMASHEFRTPLSTILSSASLIAKYHEEDQQEQRIKHVERIKSSVNNLTTILNDFLSLGKLEEGKVQCHPTEFNIESFAQDITSELRELTKKGQTIHYSHFGEENMVVLDKNLTRNICINLLSNAIKYSNESTRISIQTVIDDINLIIKVTDQGIGIPESEHQHVFDRFFRANNAINIQGTGLGLNIVKKYVELMQGSISFESKDNLGTTFTVQLPKSLKAF